MDEFESVFRSAVKPTVEVEPLPMQRLLVVLDVEGSAAKRQALVDASLDLCDRHSLQVVLVTPLCPGRERSAQRLQEIQNLSDSVAQRLVAAGAQNLQLENVCRPPHAVILEATERFQPSMLVMSSLFGEDYDDLEHFTLGSTADRVLGSSSEPILLIEGDIPSPERLWSDILIYAEDPVKNSVCLAATRALALKNARTHLFHVIEDLWLEQLHHAVELASEVPLAVTEEALVRSLRGRMTRYLEAAQGHLNATGHQASYEIVQGDPIDLTRQQIVQRKPGLLICNSLAPDHKLIDSTAYNLAAYVREIPLLLC
jgi:nucleotide-binding universal stress UspA family protein